MRYFILIVLAVSACEQQKEATVNSPASTASATSSVAAKESASAKPSASASASASDSTTANAANPVFHLTGFAAPESVLYDADNDRYVVSNINGKPAEADNNGFISIVSPDGKMVTEKWIAGGANKVTLDAPKGLAIAGGALYVADLTNVRKFDLKTGAPLATIAIAGATFLNDVTSSPDGKVYVSDTGVKAGEKGLEPTGTDAVYVIEKDKPRPLAKDKELHGPNGVLAVKDGVLVVTMNAAEVYRLDDAGKKTDVTPLPEGGLDGIVKVGDSLYISSWHAKGIYEGTLKGTFTLAFSGLESPADIGFDTKRSRLLVPRMMQNAVEAYDVK